MASHYKPGDRIIYSLNPIKELKGTIRYLRDDSYEKEMRKKDSFHYYYYIDFDNGKFDTYVHALSIKRIEN
jgi:hypothetical protein